MSGIDKGVLELMARYKESNNRILLGQHTLNVVCKKLSETAKPPSKSRVEDEGWDLFSDQDILLPVGQFVEVHTNIALGIYSNHWGLILDRSSMGKKGLFRLAGVIDNGYRGELIIILAGLRPAYIKQGDKIAQIVFIERTDSSDALVLPVVNELDESERGSCGFGSTDVVKQHPILPQVFPDE